MRGLDDFIWQLIGLLWEQTPEARPVAESVRDLVQRKLRAGGKIRNPPFDQDPEWDLDFLKCLGVSTSPLGLRRVPLPDEFEMTIRKKQQVQHIQPFLAHVRSGQHDLEREVCVITRSYTVAIMSHIVYMA